MAKRTRDIAAAEDALAEAFAKALETWPTSGVPDAPDAWLITAARRAAGHAWRKAQNAKAAEPTLEALAAVAQDAHAHRLPDERLALLCACAHPAIDPGVRTPLMLQVVLGLDAAAVARAFAVAPAAMGQRLVRAKAKIRDAGLAFDLPGPEALPERLAEVMAAVYAAYAAGRDAAWAIDDPRGAGAREEAVHLARVLVDAAPAEPEAKGLLALMLYAEARRQAGRNAAGAYVPLSEQNPADWDRDALHEAEGQLTRAARAGRFGRYQTEAAIQSLHMRTRLTGRAPGPELVHLYDYLIQHSPSLGAEVARAAAIGAVEGPSAGLAALNALDPKRAQAHQPYWAARLHMLARLGRAQEAEDARAKALDGVRDDAVRAYLAGVVVAAPADAP